MQFEFYVPSRIIFGEGSLAELGKRELPGKKALLVTSSGSSAKKSGAFDKVFGILSGKGVEVVSFCKIGANPDLDTVNEGARCARENCCDFVVALGGGSVMDASKAIALAAPNGENYWDFVAAGTGGGKPIKNKPLPLVAITTTAGTGSEADATAVVTNPATNEKIGFVHPGMFPMLSVVDSSLTLGVPPQLTAFQGFDALFHATECYVSNKANKMSDMLALTSMEYASKYLARAVSDGSDAEARDGMSFANMLSGMVMTLSGCTSKHGMEHAMSAHSPKFAHGAGLIMLAPAYYEHMISVHACDERFIKMARAIGAENAGEPADFVEALKKLMQKCGVSNLKMSDYGISPEDFSTLAKNAMSSMKRVFLNDRVPMSVDDVISIYQNSYK